MPPELSEAQHGGDVKEEGGFFSKIPIWAWIAAGLVVVYVLYTKMGRKSTSNPLVSTNPSSDPTASNLSGALGQIQANEQQLATLLGTGVNPAASSTMNNTPATASTVTTSDYNPAQSAPTAQPPGNDPPPVFIPTIVPSTSGGSTNPSQGDLPSGSFYSRPTGITQNPPPPSIPITPVPGAGGPDVGFTP